MQTLPKLVTIAYIAAYTHHHPGTVRGWIRKGLIPERMLRFTPTGRMLVVMDEFEEYLKRSADQPAQNQVEQRAPAAPAPTTLVH